MIYGMMISNKGTGHSKEDEARCGRSWATKGQLREGESASTSLLSHTAWSIYK